MTDFFSASGAQETFSNIVKAMARGDWATADNLAAAMAATTAQGDFDAVYGAAYSAYIESK